LAEVAPRHAEGLALQRALGDPQHAAVVIRWSRITIM
jgi:hypothetical protein